LCEEWAELDKSDPSVALITGFRMAEDAGAVKRRGSGPKSGVGVGDAAEKHETGSVKVNYAELPPVSTVCSLPSC
jgi:hypothetical protein